MKWSGTAVSAVWPLIKSVLQRAEFTTGYCMTDEAGTVGAAAWTATAAGAS